MRENGEVLLTLDEDATRRELEFLKSEGVESVGICFLHAYENPEHERRVRELVEEVMPGAYVQTSAVWPLAREFERTFVVMLDAYTGPAGREVPRAPRRAPRRRPASTPAWRSCRWTAACAPVESVRTAPVYTLQSGPVAGLLGAETYSRELLDGKTSSAWTSAARARISASSYGGRAEVTNEWELEHAIPLAITTLDVRSIGAGGGSIIGIDQVGSLTVGPESAGSSSRARLLQPRRREAGDDRRLRGDGPAPAGAVPRMAR